MKHCQTITYVDYKNTELLKRFMTPQGRIMSARRTRLCAKSQRDVANAIKRARFLALLPYIAR
ncbi:MAG: 30S ribosomal protein S18 [bacterium]|nr:30S ribosomal protein S18 [bacterium]